MREASSMVMRVLATANLSEHDDNRGLVLTKESCRLHISGYNLWADCQRRTLVPWFPHLPYRLQNIECLIYDNFNKPIYIKLLVFIPTLEMFVNKIMS